jgi:hypothetical protein
MNSIIFAFLLLNFFVGVFSDIVLNYSNLVPSLKPYFENKTVIASGIYAGLTILIALIITIFISYFLFGFFVPVPTEEFIKFISLAAIVGYLADYFIYYAKIFGTDLNAYYQSLGVGLWGALAFVFSISISYIMIKLYRHLL